MPVGSPGASGVVGIARVRGLRVHGDAVLPRQLPGLGGGNTEAAQLDRGQRLVELEAIGWLTQRADRGGELSAARLESDPGGARWGNINLEGRQTGNLNSKCEKREEEPTRMWLSKRLFSPHIFLSLNACCCAPVLQLLLHYNVPATETALRYRQLSGGYVTAERSR